MTRLQQAFEARAKKDAAAPRPPAKIVQFPLAFPEESPPVSNVIAPQRFVCRCEKQRPADDEG